MINVTKRVVRTLKVYRALLPSDSGPSTGEANTGANVGTAGVGVFHGKSGAELQFRKINAASAKLTVTLDVANQKIDIDLGVIDVADVSGLAAYVSNAIASLVDSSPSTLDTLNELAAALGDDPNFATTITNALAGKSAVGHTHNKSEVGLANVDNTSDADKPISTAVQSALNGKADVATRLMALVVEADFLNPTSPFAQGLAGTAVSSGTAVMVAAEPNHPGIIELRDSTTAAGGYRIMTDVLAYRLSGAEKFVCTFQMRGVRSTMTCRLGFQDSTSATAPADGVYLDFVGDGSAITVTGRARNNNAQTNTGSTFQPVVNTWYTCIIEMNADATLATFSIYNESGVLQWADTVAANIPTGLGRETGAGVYVGESTTDAAAGIIRLDYMRIEINRALVR